MKDQIVEDLSNKLVMKCGKKPIMQYVLII